MPGAVAAAAAVAPVEEAGSMAEFEVGAAFLAALAAAEAKE